MRHRSTLTTETIQETESLVARDLIERLLRSDPPEWLRREDPAASGLNFLRALLLLQAFRCAVPLPPHRQDSRQSGPLAHPWRSPERFRGMVDGA